MIFIEGRAEIYTIIEWSEIHLDRKSIFHFPKIFHRSFDLRSFISTVYASMDEWKRERKKEELRAIDNYRWPLPLYFVYSTGFVHVRFGRIRESISPTLSLSLFLSLFVRTTLPCVAFRDPLQRVKRADERVNTRECVRASQSVSLTPRRAAPSPPLRPHRFVPVARNNRV